MPDRAYLRALTARVHRPEVARACYRTSRGLSEGGGLYNGAL
jgi:hypothetical protein